MLLTIGMIVKNEEKNLEACLNGIKPILDRVDSELIIADTGSTDRTVEIAKKFTDNVFYFEWIKDFAAARNATLERAKGEWFMFVDGDEVFPSCEELIEFFNSGEYKKYNSGSYIQRNFEKFDSKDVYSDFRAPRLTKIFPQTRFVNPVHEIFNTYGNPIKYVNDYVEHFGYCFVGEEDKYNKSKRNSEILLKRLETEGDSEPLIYQQIFDCYFKYDNEKALYYLNKGIEVCRETKSIVLVTLYVSKISFHYSNNDYEDAVQMSDEYFSMDKAIRPHPLVSDLEVLGFRVAALYKLHRFDEAIKDYIRYFSLYRDYKNGKLDLTGSTTHVFWVATDRQFISILTDFANACCGAGKPHIAAEYLKSISAEKYGGNEAQYFRLAEAMMEVLKSTDFKNAKKFCLNLDEQGKRVFKRMLRTEAVKAKNPDEIIGAILSVSDNLETAALCGIYRAAALENVEIIDKIADFAEKYNIAEYGELLYLMMREKMDISPLLTAKTADLSGWVRMCHVYMADFYDIAKAYSPSFIKDKAAIVPAAALYGYILKAAANFGVKTDNLPEIISEIGGKYIAEFGDGDIDEQVAFAVALRKIELFRVAGDFRSCIAELKQFIGDFPEYLAGIAAYQNRIIDEYENSKPKSEMEMLIERIKNNICGFISSGNLYSAAITLSEYKKINPADPDIALLEEEIASKSE